jgi:hypothetical protein
VRHVLGSGITWLGSGQCNIYSYKPVLAEEVGREFKKQKYNS